MPIKHEVAVRVLSQDEFHAIDRTVMRFSFDIQNEFGRFYDERIYQKELAFRCQREGFEVLLETPVCVVHGDFEKRYFLDMLINQGAVYELKAVEGLLGIHETQLIQYLLLLGIHHGKLINFHPASVEHRFVSTRLTAHERHAALFEENLWEEISPEDHLVREKTHDLIGDWGCFLDVGLYEESLIHFLGGSEKRIQPVDVCVNNRVVGRQKLCLLTESAALHVSSIKKHHHSYRKHIERLFEHTGLTRIQWVNFNQNRVEMITLKK
jgi:GxxExxY protein